MPDLRSNPGVYVTNDASVKYHNQPVYLAAGNLRGIALKQKAPAYDAPLTGATGQTAIAASEQFYLKDKGECRVRLSDHAGITATAIGDLVYITNAGALTSTVGTNATFGRIVENGTLQPGTQVNRGTGTGFVRIDMDRR